MVKEGFLLLLGEIGYQEIYGAANVCSQHLAHKLWVTKVITRCFLIQHASCVQFYTATAITFEQPLVNQLGIIFFSDQPESTQVSKPV